MPWYLSTARVGLCAFYTTLFVTQATWIYSAEDRYRRSLKWIPTVGTISAHSMSLRRLGSSIVEYTYEVDGIHYTGGRFKSGGIGNEEQLSNPTLLGIGTELVIHYDPADPSESAIKIQADRAAETFFMFGMLACAIVAYRAVRCETIVPNLYYRALGGSRRLANNTGLKARRTHVGAKMKYGNQSGAI